MQPITSGVAKILAAGATLAAAGLAAGPALAAPAPPVAAHGHRHGSVFVVRQILNGALLSHTFVPAGAHRRKTEPLAFPDDMTRIGRNLFTGFQNGVGPQGEPSADGNRDSTVVEYTMAGRVIRQWDLRGKCDGLTADPARHELVATVNEDAHSSIYTITPGAPPALQVQHYRYNKPLPHFGGTDAISFYRRHVFVSASAPGTTGQPAPQPSYPAVYSVTFNRAAQVATVTPVFYDEATAQLANAGQRKTVKLGLTDPDSNEVVPPFARRFRGDFMLTSQGDKEQIFVQRALTPRQRLRVLDLTQSVDDTAWASGPRGSLFAASTSLDVIDQVTGPFRRGGIFVAVTPCDADNAPATCPAPGFPPNYLGQLNPFTGTITTVPTTGGTLEPQGMIFARSHGRR